MDPSGKISFGTGNERMGCVLYFGVLLMRSVLAGVIKRSSLV